jgi:hypothetical protein
MKILVVGSFHSPENTGGKPNEDFFNSKNTTVFQSACKALGAALARKKHTIMVGVPEWSMLKSRQTVATFIVEGASMVKAARSHPHKVIFYGPQELEPGDDTPKRVDSLLELKQLPHIEIEDKFEGRGNSKAGIIPNIADVDAVMLISGQEGTESIGYAAYSMDKPVIAITSLDGAAARIANEVLSNVYIERGYITASQIRDLEAYWNEDGNQNKEIADKVVSTTEKLVEAFELSRSPKEKKFAEDEQGNRWQLVPEKPRDQILAIASIIYLLLAMAFFLWLLFDVWIGQYTLAKLVRYPNIQYLDTASFHLAAYAFIGGALGGIMNGIRSCVKWHAELFAFAGRFIWKYIPAPWVGAALGLVTFVLEKGGVAVFGGNGSTGGSNPSQVLATFGVGVLAGFGSPQVFMWLDALIGKIFKASSNKVVVTVPQLNGLTKKAVMAALQQAGLTLGEIKVEHQTDAAKIGKVIGQSPEKGKTVDSGSAVDITLGSAKATELQKRK